MCTYIIMFLSISIAFKSQHLALCLKIIFIQVDLIHEPFAHLTYFAAATPQPTVRLANSTLQSLFISWSVTSPQDVTNYTVFWWKEFAEISKSVALNDTKFVIEDLLSNTAYHVAVLASGPLGNVNSTSKVVYTTPEQIQGKVS